MGTPRRVRPAGAQDASFLREMLYEAASWRSALPRPSIEEVMANPHVAVYIDGWGRKGDVGVISEDENGRPLGAAWYRVFTEEKHGYGFVQRDTPEATIAVIGEARGRGVGTALLEALICQARAGGFPALSLSVEEDNPAVALYERCGFIRFLRVEKASTMRLGL